MILKWFIRHQWKEMKRSTIWQKNLALNIVLGFLIFIMLIYLLMLGLLIDVILEKMFPDKDPVAIFNGILIYYFSAEFLMRFFMQSLPTLNVETYLHLPVKKSTIVHYVASRSIIMVGNYLSWLVLIPFAFKVIAPAYSPSAAIAWLLAMIMLVFTNNFILTWTKRQLVSRPVIVGVFALLYVGMMLLDYFGYFSLSVLSSKIFSRLLTSPVWLLIPAAMLVFSYLLNYFFLRSRLYPEEVTHRKTEAVDSLSNIKYLKTLGLTGQLISLELKLLWRHKRTRSILYLAPIYLGYGFFFYPHPEYQNMNGWLIFVGVFMTGGMMMAYLNYCFGYESNYFDVIMAVYKDYDRYIRVKYLLGIMISTVCFVVTILYVLFSVKILLINFVTWLYNVGVLSFILYYMSTYSRKRMDLSRSASFNYQGVGATHWISVVPAFLLPLLIYAPFGLLGYPVAGFIFIGAIGLAGLVFHKSLLHLIMKRFYDRRHLMAEGFRE